MGRYRATGGAGWPRISLHARFCTLPKLALGVIERRKPGWGSIREFREDEGL